MRTLLRAGAIALAASSALLASAAAAQAATAHAATAQAAPADGITVKVNRLVLDPGTSGHTGSIRIVVRNNSADPYSGVITITEPIADSFSPQITGASGCVLGQTADHRSIEFCQLDEVAPGGTVVVTQGFQSPAKPRRYAQIAPSDGTVEAGGQTAEFPALFRSTTGSLRNPRPYVQATTASLAVAAPSDVTLTRQADGTFAGDASVQVTNNNDAPQQATVAQIAAPAGLDEWPGFAPSTACVLGGDLPVPDGGIGISCDPDGIIAEGQTVTYVWSFHAPADASAGPLGTATAKVTVQGEAAAQTDGANLATFGLTIAG